MQRLAFSFLRGGAVLGLVACGGADSGEATREAPRAPLARSEAAPLPQAPAEMPVVAPAGSPAAAPVQEPLAAPMPAQQGTAAGHSRPSGGASASTPEPAGTPDAAPVPGSPDEILRRAERTYNRIRTLEASFVQNLSVPLLGSEQRSSGKLYIRRPDRFLMKFEDPAGDVLVADGQYLWMYYPSTDRTQVLRTSVADGQQQVDLQQEFLSNAPERFRSTLLKEETVGGRPAYVLDLVPRTASPYQRVKVWIDKGDFLSRRFEITEENGSVRRLELRGLQVDGSVPDQLFRFQPPPGTQVFTR